MSKSYVQIMLNQEQIIVKVSGSLYFKGFDKNDRFEFTEDPNTAFIFKNKDEFINALILLNCEYKKEVKLLRLNENNEFVNLEIYNNFILAELQIESENYSNSFQEDYCKFMKDAKFKLSFTIDNVKMWLKEYPEENIKSCDKIKKYLTDNINEAVILDFEKIKERKAGDTEDVTRKMLEVIKTAEFDFIIKPNRFVYEAFSFAYNQEMEKHLAEEMKTAR